MNEIVTMEDLPDATSLSFLPWAHCIGKNCELHNMLQRGGKIGLAEDISTIPSNLQEVKPTILFSVPTLFKKIHDRMQDKVG